MNRWSVSVCRSAIDGSLILNLWLDGYWFEMWHLTGFSANPLLWFRSMSERLTRVIPKVVAVVKQYESRKDLDQKATNALAKRLFEEAMVDVRS